MRIPHLFRRSNVRDLETLRADIKKILNRVKEFQAFREKMLERIYTSCGELKNGPTDRKARNNLLISLRGERRFLKLIREGAKEVISILKVTLREIRGSKLEQKIKAELLQIIQYIIDAMQFAKGKIKVIEKRIRKGERLESKDYAGEHIDVFLETLEEEKEIDKELGLILEGKSKKIIGRLDILKYMSRKDILATGLGFAAFEAGVAYGGSMHFTGSGVPSEGTLIPIIITIIGASLAIMVNFSKSTLSAEERRRKGMKEIPYWRRF